MSIAAGLALVTSQTAIPAPLVSGTSAPAAVVAPQRSVTSCAIANQSRHSEAATRRHWHRTGPTKPERTA